MSEDMNNINGRYLAYRYYGDTSVSFEHGGIVVVASHHDKENHKLFCGVCVVPNHVSIAHGPGLRTIGIPHKYDRRAARAIAASRAMFSITGEWSSEVDELVSKYATWSPVVRQPTNDEIQERSTAFRHTLEGYNLSAEKIEERVSSYISNMIASGVADVPSPSVFHRPESSFVVEYDLHEVEEVTRLFLDDLIEEAIIDKCEKNELPRWVGRLITERIDSEDDESGTLHIVSGEGEDGNRTFSIGRVDMDSFDVPSSINFIGPSFASLDQLGEFIDAIKETFDETMNNELPIVRSESIENPEEDEIYEYADDFVDHEDGEDDEDSDDVTEGEDDEDDEDDDDDDINVNPSQPLSEEQLEKWESGRDLVAEIKAGVDDFLAGSEAPMHVVEVTQEVHDARMKQGSEILDEDSEDDTSKKST